MIIDGAGGNGTWAKPRDPDSNPCLDQKDYDNGKVYCSFLLRMLKGNQELEAAAGFFLILYLSEESNL